MIERVSGMDASPSGDLQAEIVRGLSDTIRSLGYNAEGLDFTLRPIPLEGAWGFGSAAAFQLRRTGAVGNPPEIAERIAAAIPALPQLERVEAVNGYVNFYVDKNWYANRVVGQVATQAGDYGCWPDRGERVMVEYANLNTHKYMHVGHLRNVVLGNTIFNILKCAGFDTVGATYIGDIGMHVMRTLWGYLNFHKGQEPETGKGAWLETVYVDAAARLDYRERAADLIIDAAPLTPALAEQVNPDLKTILVGQDRFPLNLWDALGNALADTQNSKLKTQNSELASLRRDYDKLNAHRDWWEHVPQWRDEIKQTFARWEAQDPEIVALWTETREWSLDMLRRIFDDLGVHFDVWFFESEVEHPGKVVVEELVKIGLAEDHRAEGETVIVRIDDKLRADPRLSEKYRKELYKVNKDGTTEPKEAWRVLPVLRSDGTSLYATKDLELARRKFEDWRVDRSIYVIDTRQSLYFQQIFRTLELWGYPQAEKGYQLAYEMVNTPEGAISSRKGGAPPYESFEAEALKRARAIVEKKEAEQPRNLSEAQRNAIARAVAYGAMKMGMLDKDNNRVITFDWEQALNPESQSATFVQYSHARATRVLEKAPAGMLPKADEQYDFTAPSIYETSLLEMIARLPEEVARAAEAYKPVTIATYCFDLADAFNNFYHNCPVLKAPSEELVRSRLALTAASKQTLQNALGLLGIEAPEIM